MIRFKKHLEIVDCCKQIIISSPRFHFLVVFLHVSQSLFFLRKMCFTSRPGGNQVDGLPAASSMGAGWS